MPIGRISKKSVDALVCLQDKDRTILWDTDLAGFGVAAFPSGAKSYLVQYRQRGISRRAQLGKHGRLTPEEARSEAKKLLGLAESGMDPIAAKKAARDVPVLREVAGNFLRLHVATKRKARTYDEYARLVNQRIVPIHSKDVNRFHHHAYIVYATTNQNLFYNLIHIYMQYY